MNKIGFFLTKCFHYIFMLFVFFLAICSLFVTATHEKYADGSVQEFAKVTANNIPLTIVLFIVSSVFIFSLIKLFKYVSSKVTINTNIAAIIVSLIAFCLSITWILITNIIPGADQELCVRYAIAMNNGDYSCMNRGGYLSNYQVLLGIVSFLRILFKWFGEGNYDAFRIFNALCVPLLIYSGFRITKILSKNNTAVELLYLFLMFINVPMYSYVLFVYGDLSGASLGLFACWMFIELMEDFKPSYLIAMLVASVLAITLRTNSMIFVIAMIVVLIVRMITKFRLYDLLTTFLLIAVLVISNIYVSWFYLPRTFEENASVPVWANIAMSLNYDNDYAGWYNYYELVVLYDNDCNSIAAAEEAKHVIKDVYIPLYLNNPKYAVDFFFNKINSQWQSPMYQGIITNNLLYGSQNSFVMSVYTGTWGKIFNIFMKNYQMVMYATLSVYLYIKRKDNIRIEYYTTLITVFGGFLLSIIWEAKGRYILPYFFCMIPFFATGVCTICDTLFSYSAKIHRSK